MEVPLLVTDSVVRERYMRRTIARLIEILDGSPAERRSTVHDAGQKRRKAVRGQSLVEMAFITPILIIMFAGLVEIGWLADTYLDLLDVTRYGARRAATLGGERSPLSWANVASPVPNGNVSPQFQLAYASADPGAQADEENSRYEQREIWTPPITTRPAPNPLPTAAGSVCANPQRYFFYSDTVCTMLVSLTPRRLNPYNGVDDVVVSAFSLVRVDVERDLNVDGVENWTMGAANRPIAAPLPQLIVAARYPTNTNECQVDALGASAPTIFDARDPFDMNGNQLIDSTNPFAVSPYTVSDFDEIAGYDATVTATSPTPNAIEKQVGFVWYGNHVIPNTGCIGSEWSIARVENLFNLQNYAQTTEERLMIPNQGVVLVEVYYEHTMLLQIPVLSPVFEIFSQDGRPDLSLWAIFPLPSVEPYFEFE